MFEGQFESLFKEINRNQKVFELLVNENPHLNQFLSATDLIDKFLSSKDIPWQSEILNTLVKTSRIPILQQFCYLIITAIFWRNLSYLATSCKGRQIVPEDLHAQANLSLLQLVSKAAQKPVQEKIYSNLSRSLRRDFYRWVEKNDFQFSEIPESLPEISSTPVDTDKIIKQILSKKLLLKREVELWISVEKDERSLKEIAKTKGIKYDAFQKRIRRINQKIEKHKK
jgi:hypothetical protein